MRPLRRRPVKFLSKIDSTPYIGPLVFVVAVVLTALLPLAIAGVAIHKLNVPSLGTLAQ